MAATSWNALNARILADAGGGVPPVYSFPEGSTQSYKAGALVVLEGTSGQINAYATDGEAICGVVLEDASGTQATMQKVQIVRAGDRIALLCWDTSDNALVAADTLKAGFTYAIEVISGVSYAEYDTEHATTENIHFIQAMYDSSGTSTNWGIFSVETNSLQFGKTA
jgi:predicted RecA/RadA family phage recombinase